MKFIGLSLLAFLFLWSCAKSGGAAPSSLDQLVVSNPTDPRNCVDVLAGNSAATSGIFTIDPDGASGPLTSLQVYCDMTTNGGGWTLVMKQKAGDGTTLQGDSTYFTSAATAALNDTSGNLNISDQNLVSAAFTKIPVTQMMLIAGNEVTVRTQAVTATSAFAAFQTPADFTDDANATRPNWFINTSSYPNGNALTSARFGFNIRQMVGGAAYCAARWGWTGNQDAPGGSLGSADSCGGLGAYGTQYGSSYMSNSKNTWQPSYLLLFIK